jgi:aldehyde dehydrogenase (NAD+)
LLGGSEKIDRENLYVCPTVIENPPIDSKIMSEENFCPVLPLQTYNDIQKDVIDKHIHRLGKPLAIYYFGTKGDSNW